jgi:CubicO group peptidase (beta-lactamase class C family)
LLARAASDAAAQRGAYHAPDPAWGLPVPVAPRIDVVASERIDHVAADALEREVESTGGCALVVLRRGELAHAWFDAMPEPIELMSATKSVVALGVGVLLDEGKIRSIDDPVVKYLPDFTGNGRDAITIRHLLTHTSDLDPIPPNEIYQVEDTLAFAIGSKPGPLLGQTFVYNNNACNLLMGVVGAAAGEPGDVFIARRIFVPLGISDWSWYRDPAENPHGMAGLKLHAIDAARIGELVRRGGAWNGKPIVSSAFVEQMLRPGQPMLARCGMLWWRAAEGPTQYRIDPAGVDTLEQSGAITQVDADALRALVGTQGSRQEVREAVAKALGSRADPVLDADQAVGSCMVRATERPAFAFYADGYLGQFIIVLPQEEIVVVRQQTRRDHPTPLNVDRLLELARHLVAHENE